MREQITEKENQQLQSEEIDQEQKQKYQLLENQLNMERQYLSVICRKYILVYDVDLDKDCAQILKLDEHSNVWKMEEMRPGTCFAYEAHIYSFAQQYVVDSKWEFQRKLDRDYIAKRLEHVCHYTFRYEGIPNASKNHHYEVQVIRVNPEEYDGRALIVAEEIDDVVHAELRHLEELDAERQYQDMLSRDFTSVYHVNLDWDAAMPLKQTGNTNAIFLHTKIRQEFFYTEVMQNYCETYLPASAREGFAHFMDRKNLRKTLRVQERCAYRYRSKKDPAGHEQFEVQAIRLNNDPADSNILLAFRYIDDLVTAEQQRQYELEEGLERERAQNEDFVALGRTYHAILGIDLRNDRYTIISCRNEVRHYYNESISSASQMLGEVCEKIVAEKDHRRMRRFFRLNTLKQRLRTRDFVEAECITKEGDWHRARLTAKRRDAEGNVTHVLYVTQIINDEKQYEEHLIAKAEYANLANQSKSGFISQVAHDIRTPMNAILGFLEIAEANLDDPEKVRYSLEKIRTAGEFLKDLVKDVLDISHMENGKLVLQQDQVKLSHVLEEIAAAVQLTADERRQSFRMDVHNIVHDWIITDELRMMQIYTNVLSNAIKYTPDGGIVEFTVYQEEMPLTGRVRIVAKVTDTGIGMTEEFMENMFLKFERGTDTRINKISGYGLGLSIVKQLVDRMGGTIEAQSQLGEGTVFCIRLEVPYVQDVVEESVPPEKDYDKICAGMHLLVAEDNALNQEVITQLLAMHDITCECTEDGEECLKQFQKAPQGTYEAILMDMQMPVMNGIEATRQIRALSLPWAKNVPIIAMTANAMKDDVKSCMDAGMNWYLAKPVDMEQMMKTLAKVRSNIITKNPEEGIV